MWHVWDGLVVLAKIRDFSLYRISWLSARIVFIDWQQVLHGRDPLVNEISFNIHKNQNFYKFLDTKMKALWLPRQLIINDKKTSFMNCQTSARCVSNSHWNFIRNSHAWHVWMVQNLLCRRACLQMESSYLLYGCLCPPLFYTLFLVVTSFKHSMGFLG